MIAHALQWHPLGAHLLQCALNGAALFYCSPRIAVFPDRPPRGGVPVMFPQFAERGPGPKHGLVRMLEWARIPDEADTFTVEVPPQADHQWLGHARLTLSARQTASELTQTLTVENAGDTPFAFTGGLHPYWAVRDVAALAIEGLDGVAFDDRYASTHAASQPFLKGQAFERLYRSAPELRVNRGDDILHITCNGFDNWMVWNPGAELARDLPDLPPDDWRRFVCIEPVVAAEPRVVEPGARFVGGLSVRLVSSHTNSAGLK